MHSKEVISTRAAGGAAMFSSLPLNFMVLILSLESVKEISYTPSSGGPILLPKMYCFNNNDVRWGNQQSFLMSIAL